MLEDLYKRFQETRAYRELRKVCGSENLAYNNKGIIIGPDFRLSERDITTAMNQNMGRIKSIVDRIARKRKLEVRMGGPVLVAGGVLVTYINFE